MVTSATHKKTSFFDGPERLTYLHNSLLELAEQYGWRLQAWAVFPNHYHFLGESLDPESLPQFLRHLHSVTAIAVNKLDGAPGRRVWFQYWDTQVVLHRAYLARLGYVHDNAVHHGLVRHASLYPWCSAGWFERRARRSYYRTVMNFPRERLDIPDDF
jgi:REP-associated tyrosine transposase